VSGSGSLSKSVLFLVELDCQFCEYHHNSVLHFLGKKMIETLEIRHVKQR
jgi:hypothetical protein